jgi:outer membrane protein OmpA-like peptidoglycan-associated protein
LSGQAALKRLLGTALAFLIAGAADPPERAPPACGGFALVFFDPGSDRIDARAAAILDNEVSSLAASESYSGLKLRGHADRVGSAGFNLLLSRRRAESVRDYLAARGVPYGQIDIEAAGETRSLIETEDGVAEPQNRYVELLEIPDPAEWERRQAWWAKRGRPSEVC